MNTHVKGADINAPHERCLLETRHTRYDRARDRRILACRRAKIGSRPSSPNGELESAEEA
jgi:hypothetical protein